MVIHTFVVSSIDAHYILSPTSSERLARFMQLAIAMCKLAAGGKYSVPW